MVPTTADALRKRSVPTTAVAAEHGWGFTKPFIAAAPSRSSGSSSSSSSSSYRSLSRSFNSCLELTLKSFHLCGRFLPHDRRDVATDALESIAPRTLLRPDADELLKGVRRRNNRKHNM